MYSCEGKQSLYRNTYKFLQQHRTIEKLFSLIVKEVVECVTGPISGCFSRQRSSELRECLESFTLVYRHVIIGGLGLASMASIMDLQGPDTRYTAGD